MNGSSNMQFAEGAYPRGSPASLSPATCQNRGLKLSTLRGALQMAHSLDQFVRAQQKRLPDRQPKGVAITRASSKALPCRYLAWLEGIGGKVESSLRMRPNLINARAFDHHVLRTQGAPIELPRSGGAPLTNARGNGAVAMNKSCPSLLWSHYIATPQAIRPPPPPKGAGWSE